MNNKWTSTEAYDLSQFEETATVRQPELTVRTTKKHREQPAASPTVVFVFVLLLLTFIGMMIVNNIAAVELGEEIRTANSALAELTEEYSILSNRLQSTKNTVTVEEYAKSELGLGQISDYQVTYIRLDGGDVVTTSDTALANSLGGIFSKSVDGVLAYLKLK